MTNQKDYEHKLLMLNKQLKDIDADLLKLGSLSDTTLRILVKVKQDILSELNRVNQFAKDMGWELGKKNDR